MSFVRTIGLLVLIGVLFFTAAGLVGCSDDDDDDSADPGPESDDDTSDDDTSDDDTNDDDTPDDDDTADDDSADDDDDSFPFIAPIDPLNWKRYTCPADAKAGVSVVTGNFNIHGGKEGSPVEIGQALAEYGPFDVFSLQECPEEYAAPIAAELGMHYYYHAEQSLMTAAPMIDPQVFFFVDAGTGRFLHANIEIEGVTFSVYGVHENWNEVGDAQNRELIDDYVAVDPVDRLLLMGDWNEELGSTQAVILDEQLADGWASLGACPSCRTTWPAIMFYGAEGQQLIDNTYFNKSSGGCTVDGEIIHLTPNRSDHKPQTATIFFPETPAFTAPILLDIVHGFGPDAFALLFDKPIATADLELFLGDTEIPLVSQETIGDGTLVLVHAAGALATGAEYTVRVLSAEDVDGAQTTQSVDFDFPLYDNLLQNPGAEEDAAGWKMLGMEATDEINKVVPLSGAAFFSGAANNFRAHAVQDVPLDDFAALIDAGHGQLAFGGASATGYRVEPGGSSNILLPHDESEAVVEFFDGQGRLLKHISGGRFDTMYWQPWRVIDTIPPTARVARVILRACAAEMPMTFNSASFDALHLFVTTTETPHNLVGGNLVANPLFENWKQNWVMPGGMLLARDHWIPIRSNVDVNSATGEYWVAALMVNPGSKTVSQVIQLADYAEAINSNSLALEWGAYLRTWNPQSEAVLALTFFDESYDVLGTDQLGPFNIPEWFRYSKVTPVPAGTVAVNYEWIATTNVFLIGVGSFFDAPFVYPVGL
jgi:hypothetical protein